MQNESRQLGLRLASQSPIAVPAQKERELIEALSELLLAVANAEDRRVQQQFEGDRDDE
jgi:hypothetical protein